MNYSLEAERAILGSAICDPDSILRASDIIEPNDFYSAQHKVIYHALLDLYQLGEKIDLISLSERLATKNQLKAAGGIDAVTSITNEHVTSANIAYHARLVHQKSLLRRTGQWALSVSEQSQNGIEDVNAWLGEIEAGLVEIAQTAKGKTSPYSSDILSAIEEFWSDSLKGKAFCVPPPDFLEGPIPGFYKKHLWMIGGYTGKGKSIFLNQLLVDAMGNSGKILLFSLEDSREEKMMRMLANVANVPYKALVTGRISGHENQIRKAEKLIAQWNPIIYDDIRTVDDIRLKAKKHKIQNNIDIVAIDYVQNLMIKNTLYETMVDAAVKLYAMVNELEVTGIGVSQIDNESAKKDSGIIGLKGAGELAAAAHIVLWLTRGKGKEQRHLECSIRKNRPFGETGRIELTFSDNWTAIHRRYEV